MAIFATPVLDNFNRADESPLSAAAGWETTQWTTSANSAGPLKVISNQLRPSETGGGVWLSGQVRSAVLGPDQEAYLTLPTGSFPGGSTYHLLARADAPSGGTGKAYTARLLISNAGNPSSTTIAASTQATIPARDIASGGVTGLVPGSRMGFRVYGSDPVHLELWAYSAGAWSPVLRLVDSDAARITTAGRIGVVIATNTNQSSSQPLDDFGGGEAPATVASDIWPTLTGVVRDVAAAEGAQVLPTHAQMQSGLALTPYLPRLASARTPPPKQRQSVLPLAPYLPGPATARATLPTKLRDLRPLLVRRAWPLRGSSSGSGTRPVTGQIWPRHGRRT
jgi:hypothetical protein